MKKWLVGFVHLVGFILLSLLASGNDQAAASALDFEVTPILPDNQVSKGVNYFDLLLGKKESQTIKVKIHNLTDEKRTLQIAVNPATTNYNGVVEYLDTEIAKERLPFSIKEVVTLENEWQLAAQETIEIPLEIKMPDVEFKGVVAGGIRITDTTVENETNEAPDSKAEASGGNMVIRNKYTYVVALLLSESKEKVAPELELGQATLQTINSSDVVGINIENVANTYVSDLRVTATIKKEGEDIEYTEEKSAMKMAPNSTLNYPVPVTQELPSGDYQMTVTAFAEISEDGEYEAVDGSRYQYRWEFKENFTLEDTVIKGKVKEATTKGHQKWLYILLFVLLTGGIVIGSYFLKKRGRKRQNGK